MYNWTSRSKSLDKVGNEGVFFLAGITHSVVYCCTPVVVTSSVERQRVILNGRRFLCLPSPPLPATWLVCGPDGRLSFTQGRLGSALPSFSLHRFGHRPLVSAGCQDNIFSSTVPVKTDHRAGTFQPMGPSGGIRPPPGSEEVENNLHTALAASLSPSLRHLIPQASAYTGRQGARNCTSPPASAAFESQMKPH